MTEKCQAATHKTDDSCSLSQNMYETLQSITRDGRTDRQKLIIGVTLPCDIKQTKTKQKKR